MGKKPSHLHIQALSHLYILTCTSRHCPTCTFSPAHPGTVPPAHPGTVSCRLCSQSGGARIVPGLASAWMAACQPAEHRSMVAMASLSPTRHKTPGRGSISSFVFHLPKLSHNAQAGWHVFSTANQMLPTFQWLCLVFYAVISAEVCMSCLLQDQIGFIP